VHDASPNQSGSGSIVPRPARDGLRELGYDVADNIPDRRVDDGSVHWRNLAIVTFDTGNAGPDIRNGAPRTVRARSRTGPRSSPSPERWWWR
jgi:hypothetical protein